MIARILRSSFIFLFVLLPMAGAFQTDAPEKQPQQEGEKPVDEAQRKALREAIDGLVTANKEKSDVDIIHFSKAVGEKWKHGDKAMQDEAVTALSDGLKSKNQDAKATILDALGETGGKASQILQKEASGDVAKKNVTYLCAALRNLGKLKDEKSIDMMLKFFNNKSTDVVSQAIVSLSNFAESKIAIRRQIVEELVKIYEPLESAANKNNADTSDKEEYGKLKGPIESTLGVLTKKTGMNTATDWGKWFRKEGKKSDNW